MKPIKCQLRAAMMPCPFWELHKATGRVDFWSEWLQGFPYRLNYQCKFAVAHRFGEGQARNGFLKVA